MTGIEIVVICGIIVITIIILGYMLSEAKRGYVITPPKRDYDGSMKGVLPRYNRI